MNLCLQNFQIFTSDLTKWTRAIFSLAEPGKGFVPTLDHLLFQPVLWSGLIQKIHQTILSCLPQYTVQPKYKNNSRSKKYSRKIINSSNLNKLSYMFRSIFRNFQNFIGTLRAIQWDPL